MSVLPGGRLVRCDGHECCSKALLPVALRSTLGDTSPAAESASIVGWLFAGAVGREKHFCPRCVAHYLPQALDDRLDASAENFYAESGEAR
jgi:hypothetical protein